MSEPEAALSVTIDYTNHRGERAVRRVRPIAFFFGVSTWHEGHQWIMRAIDLDKETMREFAMSGIHGWEGK